LLNEEGAPASISSVCPLEVLELVRRDRGLVDGREKKEKFYLQLMQKLSFKCQAVHCS